MKDDYWTRTPLCVRFTYDAGYHPRVFDPHRFRRQRIKCNFLRDRPGGELLLCGFLASVAGTNVPLVYS